eukprot:Pgem_evm1s12521
MDSEVTNPSHVSKEIRTKAEKNNIVKTFTLTCAVISAVTFNVRSILNYNTKSSIILLDTLFGAINGAFMGGFFI